MEKWPQLYPTACDCQGIFFNFWSSLIFCTLLTGKNHKFFKNCLRCGLIFCQQNSKLLSCSFCSFSFSDSVGGFNDESSLKLALNLQSRLLEADSNSSTATHINDDFGDQTGSFIQTKFCPASEISAKKRQIENFKLRIAKEQAERSSFDLSKMLNL